MPLFASPDAAAVARLREAVPGPERLGAVGRQLYVTYPDGIGRSKLATARIEAALATRGTGRNWNTARKLEALARSL